MGKNNLKSKKIFRAISGTDDLYLTSDEGGKEFSMGYNMTKLLRKYMLKGGGLLAIGIDADSSKLILYTKKKYFREPSQMAVHEKFKILVSELQISNRLRHRLNNAACDTLGEVVIYGRSMISKQRNLGAGTLAELDTLMTEYGIFNLYNNSNG